MWSQARKGLGVPSRDGCGNMLRKSQTSKPRPKEGRDRWAMWLQDRLGPSRRHNAPPFVARCVGAGELKQSPLQCLAPAWVPQDAVVPFAPRKQSAKRYEVNALVT